MSIKTTPTAVISVDSTELNVTPALSVDSGANSHCVDVIPTQEVVAIKKEYSIVGDAFYAGINSDAAPVWLTNLLDAVVGTAVDNGLTNYNMLVQDVRDAVDALDIAKNTFTDEISFTSRVDGVIGTHITTLNASHESAVGQIVDLDIVVASNDEAMALRVGQVEVSYENQTAEITSIKSAYAAGDKVSADSIEALSVAFLDQESNLSGTADAVYGVQTYVGLTGDGYPNGTGMLARVSLLEKQTDGVIDYVSGNYDVMSGIDNPNTDITDDELVTDALPYVLWTVMSGAGLPVAVTRTYKDYSLQTPEDAEAPILNGTLYENSSYTNSDVDRYYVFNSISWVSITESDYTLEKEVFRTAHIGDVFIQYQDDGSTGLKSYLKGYKFIKTAEDVSGPSKSTDFEGYTWALIVDTDAQSAYTAALNAQDMADSKRRVFVDTPFAPYDEGDLWIDNSALPQTIMVCTFKAGVPVDGVFDSAHWVLADESAEYFITNTYDIEKAQLDRQIDGKIEYYFYKTYNDPVVVSGIPSISAATAEADALIIIDTAWSTQELKDDANGNIVYFQDTKNAYWYGGRNNLWQVVTDTSLYEALQDASEAQGAADGKVSQFYAWGGLTLPADYEAPKNDAYTVTDDAGNYLDDQGEITIIPGEYVHVAATTTTVTAEDFVYWFLGSTLYRKGDTGWGDKEAVPLTSGDGSYISEGDVLTVFDPVNNDTTIYSFSALSYWETTGPNGLISTSKFFVDLDNAVNGPNGVAKALTTLEITSSAYTDDKTTGVESKFTYDSSLFLGDYYYNSGFGLDSSGVSQTGSVYNISTQYLLGDKVTYLGSTYKAKRAVIGVTPISGNDWVLYDGVTAETAFDSEFWVNAERFVLKSPSFPELSAVFEVTGAGIVLGLENTKATKNEPKGDHVQANIYDKGDMVQSGGSSYIAIIDVIADILISNATYWTLLAEGGTSTPGAPGDRGTAVRMYSMNPPVIYLIENVTDNSLAGYWADVTPADYGTVEGDTLVVTNENKTSGWTHIFEYIGGVWTGSNTFTVNGNQVVNGTLASDALVTGSVFASDVVVEGSVRSGKTTYTSTTSGYWMGHHSWAEGDSGAGKLHIGDATNHLNWDGDTLRIKGDIAFGHYTSSTETKYNLLVSSGSKSSTSSASYNVVKEFRLKTGGTVAVSWSAILSDNQSALLVLEKGSVQILVCDIDGNNCVVQDTDNSVDHAGHSSSNAIPLGDFASVVKVQIKSGRITNMGGDWDEPMSISSVVVSGKHSVDNEVLLD